MIAKQRLSEFGAMITSAPIALIVFVLALLPLFTQRQDWLRLIFLLLLYICLGQSWNILGGFAGQHSLGHAAFFGIGTLVTRTLWLMGVPILLALLLGGIAAAACALMIGVPTFRLSGAYFSIGTLAVGEVIHKLVAQHLPFITTIPVEAIATYDLKSRYYLALALALFMGSVIWWLLQQPVSLGLLAVREDEMAARATGVNPLYHKLLALGLSACFAGMTGGLFAYQEVSYYPESVFSASWTLDALVITFVGGVGTLSGPIIGAFFFVALRELLAATFDTLNQIVFGTLLIVVVLLFPGGLVEMSQYIRHRLKFYALPRKIK